MITRRFGLLLVALGLFVPLACGEDAGGGDDGDGVASIDAASDDGSSDDDSGSGDGDEPTQEEFQDAALEHAQCMRENGIEDFPDPEFEEGAVAVRLPEGVDQDELAAAEEACQHIMDEVAPDAGEVDPEQQAEMQDQLLEVAECMRERGHDMPDPEVDDGGRVTFGVGPQAGERGEGPNEEFEQDMEECQEEAGMDGFQGRRRSGGGGGTSSDGGA